LYQNIDHCLFAKINSSGSDYNEEGHRVQKIIEKTTLLCLILFPCFFIACAYDTASLKIEKSLPVEMLARYNDSFDSLRGDIWGRESFIRYVPLRTNFKWADVSVDNGRLKVETKTGCFSKGGVSSKFFIRGDFDVQVDCYVDFLKGINTMDQSILLQAVDQTAELEDDTTESVQIEVDKQGMDPAFIFGAYRKMGNWNQCYKRKIGDYFKGAIRIVRIGNQVTMLYATQPEYEWQKACTLSHAVNDIRIAIGSQNYLGKKVSIDAKSTFTAWFDNFKINAAQEIIEDEI
jgi:hypothetical protein